MIFVYTSHLSLFAERYFADCLNVVKMFWHIWSDFVYFLFLITFYFFTFYFV